MNIFTITTRGLEEISSREIQAVPGISNVSSGYRHIRGVAENDLASLLDLRTVDDVFLELAEWFDISHERAMLSEFTERSALLEVNQPLVQLRELRTIPESPTFSVTANFVGKRNYSSDEIKDAVSEGILHSQPDWAYTEDDREADLNLRVFIEHRQALVGLRIGETPLHRRAYKQAQLPGSLKPTIAAAMLQFAEVQKGQVCLDPFCGSGTIVIEAALAGAQSIGGDINQEMLEAAEINILAAQVPARLQQMDAARLPLPDNSVDYVISNLPWGRQIAINGDLQNLYTQSFVEMQRVVKSSGQIVLLTSHPELLPREPDEQVEISLFGQTPCVLRFDNT